MLHTKKRLITSLVFLVFITTHNGYSQFSFLYSEDLVGEKITKISLEEVMNAPLNKISSYKDFSGDLVIIEFWATWCAPCIKNIPHLNNLYNEFKDKGVTFISVTYENRTKVERFLKRVKIDGWIGLDLDKSLIDQLSISTYPTTLLVDKTGVIKRVLKPDELTPDLITEYLN